MEGFPMSESILLLNPRRRGRNRRRRPPMTALQRKYFGKRRSRGSNRRHKPRRHHRGSNPRPMRSRRRRARAVARLARRRIRRAGRRVRRYAGRARAYGGRIGTQYVIPGVVGAGGALALDIIWGYVSPRLPTQLQSGWAALAVKLGVVVGAAYGIRRLRPGLAPKVNVAAVGAATVALYGALKGVAQSVLPSSIPGLSGYMDYQSYALPGTRMGGYMPRTLGDYGGELFSPAAVIQPAGVAVPRQFGGYIAAQPHVAGNGGLMGYDWSNDGMC